MIKGHESGHFEWSGLVKQSFVNNWRLTITHQPFMIDPLKVCFQNAYF